MASAPTSLDEIVETAPAAMRLQDIGGFILLFYRQYGKMPASLDQLQTIPGGDALNFTNSSAQPFAYFPTGLWAANQADVCIIACDPSLTPSGKRWCLFMHLPKAGAALTVDVVALPNDIFQTYRQE